MDTLQVTLNEKDYRMILDCIHSCYMDYQDGILDEDVYEFNSKLDALISRIKNNTEGK